MMRLSVWTEEQLKAEIATMDQRHKLYRILRDALRARGWWRVQPRGNPGKGFKKGWGKARGGSE